MNLAAFLEKYPPRPPQRQPANDDEVRPLGESDGVRRLGLSPAENPAGCERPTKKGAPGCHLWVFDHTGIPYLLELAEVVPPLQSGLVKHSNLTAGGPASCGGEVWLETERSTHLYINGCSGRYGPSTAEQLEDAARVLRAMGYTVTSFGWDSDANRPSMVLR
jgi:hypothetical protein